MWIHCLHVVVVDAVEVRAAAAVEEVDDDDGEEEEEEEEEEEKEVELVMAVRASGDFWATRRAAAAVVRVS